MILIYHFEKFLENFDKFNFSLKCFLLFNHPLWFFSLLTLLRLSKAKSKISLSKCHTALENMWVIFKYLLILIPNIIQQNLFCMISKPLEHEIFTPYFMSLDMFQCLLVYSLWEHWNRICILLLCENCINLNYVELIHSAFQVYYILLLLCILILLIFESLILKL